MNRTFLFVIQNYISYLFSFAVSLFDPFLSPLNSYIFVHKWKFIYTIYFVWTVVLIFTVIFTMFWPLYAQAFFRWYLLEYSPRRLFWFHVSCLLDVSVSITCYSKFLFSLLRPVIKLTTLWVKSFLGLRIYSLQFVCFIFGGFIFGFFFTRAHIFFISFVIVAFL